MKTGQSLQSLVSQHGFGITVKAPNVPPFVVTKEAPGAPAYFVAERGEHKALVLKDCLETNDYEFVAALA